MEQNQNVSIRLVCVRLAIRLFALILAIWVLVRFGGTVFSILLPFLGALLLAHLINPVIRVLQSKFGGNRKNWAIAATTLIVASLSVALTLLVFLCYEQVRLFFADWPVYLTEFLESIRSAFHGICSQFGVDFASGSGIESGAGWIIDKLTTWLSEWNPPVLESAGSVLTVASNVLITVVVFVLASCYIMADYPKFRMSLETVFPDSFKRTTHCIKNAAASAIGGYFKAQLILSMAVSAICFVVLLIMQNRFAILIAIAIGIIDFIPIFGSGTILVPWSIILLLSGNYTKALVFIILAAALFILRKLAEPRVLGDQTGLSALTSLLCIYIGMRLGGVIGMIVAPVICLMLIHMYRQDLFRGTIRDCRILSDRIGSIIYG